MKRLSLFLIALLPLALFGAANDIKITQRKADDSGFTERTFAPGANGLFGFNGSKLPSPVVVAGGLSLSGGTLTGTSGTITSVALSLPNLFTVSGSPVTSTGTLTATLATQTANTVFAGPTTGSAAAPTFRALVADDISGIGGVFQAENATLTAVAGGTYTGDDSITTLGTITTGTWNGSILGAAFGGAGTVNGILKANGSGTVSAAVAGTDYLAPAAIGTTVQAYDADLDAFALKTAPSGAVVGTTDTQTLTNKSIAVSQLTGAMTSTGATMATSRILGRTTASTGPPEEITIGSGLTLAAGELSAAGGGGLVASNNLSDVANSATAFGNIKQAATTSATGVVELATDGETAAGVVVQGNDARLANARTPSTHAASHADGGSDELLLTQAQITDLTTDLAAKQPLDTDLTALAGVTSANDRVPYFTGSGTADVTPFTSAARSLLDDSDTATQRATLGLTIGSDVQAYDVDLDGFAALTAPTSTVVGISDTQTLTNKTIDGASNDISNISLAGDVTGTLPVANGGTGATTITGLVLADGTNPFAAAVAGTDYLAPAAIGVTVQAYDADLDAFALKTAPAGAVVGTTDTQTLTNKTIVGSQVTGAYTASGLTMATARMLGRTTASAGAVEEITIGSGLTFTSGILDVTDLPSPLDATYITQTANGDLTNEQALSSLATGIVQVTTSTGVLSSVTTSAGISALLSDETGSGAAVFGTSPTIATPIFTTDITLPNSATPTTATVAKAAFDTNAWATDRGAMQIYDGTATTFVVAALASDTPSNGQIPTWNTGGTITWETPSGGSGDVSTDTIFDAKGDLVGGTGADTAARLPVGTNGQVLVADSAETTGMKWATVSGTGDVVGPASATDEAIARFDTTTGELLQNSAVTVSDAGAFTFPDDVRQTFNPGATNAGINVGSLSGDVSSPSNGDLWYDSAANELTARINGANVALGAGGGGTGDVVGPGSATDNALARFDTSSGKLIQNSNVTLGDSGTVFVFSGAAGLTAGGTNENVKLNPSGTGRVVATFNSGTTPAAALYSASDYFTMNTDGGAVGFSGIVASSSIPEHRFVFKGVRARGTAASPTTVATGDKVFTLLAAPYDGTAQLSTAALEFEVESAATSNVPVKLALFTGANGTRTEKWNIKESGQMNVLASTASTSTTTGAATVAGGLGVAGAINASSYGIGAATMGTITNSSGNIIIAGNGASNRVQIGAGSPNALFTQSNPKIMFLAEGGSAISNGSVASATNTNRNIFQAFRSRGTLASPTTVVTGDYVGAFNFAAYDGTSMQTSASIDAITEGTISSGSQAPIFLQFNAGLSAADRSEAMRITSTRRLLVGTTSETGLTGAGGVKIGSSTASTSTTSGALIVAGGIGVAGNSHFGGTLTIATATPASATATGVAGTIAWDASYIYVCIATDTWKRVAIATW